MVKTQLAHPKMSRLRLLGSDGRSLEQVNSFHREGAGGYVVAGL